jgi:hypothetical protein
MAVRKQTIIRLTDDQEHKLDALAQITNQSKNEVIIGLITGEYDRINGNPQMKELLKKMSELADQMKEYQQGKSD